MARKSKQKFNGQLTTATSTTEADNSSQHKTSSLLPDDSFESSECVDFDEISTTAVATDDIDHEKCEAFRRIASAEEIEEMSDEFLENHVDLASLSPERRAKLEEELKKELAGIEEEIQTLRHVLNAKIKHSQDLKRRLGITVWQEFRDDMGQGIRNIQETTAYQKTTEAVKIASEKTTSMIGSFGGSMAKKLGEVKNSNAFKSFEERVGYAVTNVKTKIASRSNSTVNFDEALQNQENNQFTTSSTANNVTSPTIPEDKPLS